MNSGEQWRGYVRTMCHDGWAFGPQVTQRVIEGIEFLVASDQVSDFAVAEVLLGHGVKSTEADQAAPRIHKTIKRY
jgi:hypothetical protein